MSDINMLPIIEQLQSLKREQESLQEQIKALEDQVKARMGEQELLIAGSYKVTYKHIESSRLDTKRLQSDLGKDVLAEYYNTSVSRRFCVS